MKEFLRKDFLIFYNIFSKYVSEFILVIIDSQCKVNEKNGMPLDELSQDVKNWCQSLGCKCETVSDIIRQKPRQVYDAIQQGINRANVKAISRVHQIRKFTILLNDFSINTGELGSIAWLPITTYNI